MSLQKAIRVLLIFSLSTVAILVLFPKAVLSQGGVCETDKDCSRLYASQGKCKIRSNAIGAFAAALPLRMLPLILMALYQLVLKALSVTFHFRRPPTVALTVIAEHHTTPIEGLRKGTYKNTEKRGGNVTIYIVAAKNLKNTDLTPLAIESDPFVRVTIPRHCSDPDFDSLATKCVGEGLVYTNEMVRTSSTIANSVNPKWPGIGEPLHFGFTKVGNQYFWRCLMKTQDWSGGTIICWRLRMTAETFCGMEK